MIRSVIILVIITFCFSCKQNKSNTLLNDGMWRAQLKTKNGDALPFNFRVIKSETDSISLEILNAEEVITVDEVEIIGDSIRIQPPIFEGYIAGIFTENSINGKFIKESLDRAVTFSAKYGEKQRFLNTSPANFDVSGSWETVFSDSTKSRYEAKGIFEQTGSKVTGTFETPTGDYRFLEGVVAGDSLKLSAFDGAHAFLFLASYKDRILDGVFYSDNHFEEPFRAKRNDNFTLPDADSLTFLKDGYDEFNFAFPDKEGRMVSLKDEKFKNKVVLVQIMGSWCPNCLDETKFYMDYLSNEHPKDLEIVALAFEYAKTQESAFKSLERLKKRMELSYPILLAQYGTSNKVEAQKKLPMLNHVLSYPTTIHIDKKGEVRKIHTGFNGPATGEKFREFKKEFQEFTEALRNE
ncbi:TlpA disulfide reductase family protein [Cytophaga sp. FL35]|uniref:peroxiredoxin family protein n=1 Tax=Cytophaga sp. FL35 TaxID=1904456 RepID=UPI0016539444|nr:TlpA disulfide reductase family protein [Cytophaga sp. FL35]MBC6998754.1 TlpA family protein disulfide reductase [Cytophaga sp. FL35]